MSWLSGASPWRFTLKHNVCKNVAYCQTVLKACKDVFSLEMNMLVSGVNSEKILLWSLKLFKIMHWIYRIYSSTMVV